MKSSTLNLHLYSVQEQEKILSHLSCIELTNRNQEFKEKLLNAVVSRARGYANYFRLGVSKIHQHASPKIISPTIICSGLRKLALKVRKHDFQCNKAIIDKRLEKKMRLNIRTEREESLKALSMLFIKYLDLDLFGVGLFEVKCPIEQLAKEMGVYYKTLEGKIHYDIALNALNDFEEAGLILVFRAKDELTKGYKASRIWLKPEFFYSIGYNVTDLKDMVFKRYQYLRRNNKVKEHEQKYNRFLERLEKHGIFDLKPSFYHLLIKIKRQLLGALADKMMINESENKKEHEQRKKNEYRPLQQKDMSLQEKFHYQVSILNLPQVLVFKIIESIKKQHPDIPPQNDKFWSFCIAEIDIVQKQLQQDTQNRIRPFSKS